MKLQEILARKLQEKKATNKSSNSISETSTNLTSYSKEQKLLAFLLLYYKSHAKDTYINHGEGALLLYRWLEVEKIEPTTPLPLGLAVGDQYIMYNVLGLHPATVYRILENFRLDKNFLCV